MHWVLEWNASAICRRGGYESGEDIIEHGESPGWVRRISALYLAVPEILTALRITKQMDDGEFSIFPENDAVFVGMNRYPDANVFDTVARETGSLLRQHATARLLVDLRHNTGGDFLKFRKHFLGELKKIPRLSARGAVIVATSRATFSAAVVNAIGMVSEIWADG